MKILITGADGQLAKAIVKSKPANMELIALKKSDLNLIDANKTKNIIREIRPNWIINCGAYTNVEKSEKESDLAMKINAESIKAISESLKLTKGNLLHISSDFVFDGKKGSPYEPYDKLCPLGIYGKSKAKGEQYINQILGGLNQGIILRTSWLIGAEGKNFLNTMLKLHQTKKQINVVTDQIGCITSTNNLANACWEIVKNKSKIRDINNKQVHIFHYCESGVTSWYDVAVAIGEIGLELKLINKIAKINPIKTIDFPFQVERPLFSLLDCEISKKSLNLKHIHWRFTLRELIKEIKQKGHNR